MLTLGTRSWFPLLSPPLQGIPQAVFIGHDWGGVVVWHMALFYPERVRWVGAVLPLWGWRASLRGSPQIQPRFVPLNPLNRAFFPPSPWCRRAVASLNTPYRPADPSVDIVEKMKSIPTFDYQFYFQEPVRKEGKFINLIILGAQNPPCGGWEACPCWAPQLAWASPAPWRSCCPLGLSLCVPPPQKKSPLSPCCAPQAPGRARFPPTGRRGGRAGEGRGAHAEGADPLHPQGGRKGAWDLGFRGGLALP